MVRLPKTSGTTVLGVIAVLGIALGVGGGLTYRYLDEQPGEPVVTVLGQRIEAEWHLIPSENLNRPPWRSRISGEFWSGEQSSARLDPDAVSINQLLFEVDVPDQLGNGHVGVMTRVMGRISDNGEFWAQINDLWSGHHGHLVRLQSAFDGESRELTVRIGWAFPRGPAQMCLLRFQLTQEGFVYLGTSDGGGL